MAINTVRECWGEQIPAEIIHLFDDNGEIKREYFFIGDILAPISDPWDRGDQYLIPLLTGGAGDTYAFWVYNNQSLNNAPIVYLCHEGWDQPEILANSVRDLIALLASGMVPTNEDDVRGYSLPIDWYLEEAIQWAEALGIEIPESDEEIIQDARNTHPDFRQWLRDHNYDFLE